jgi:hypothetical protein
MDEEEEGGECEAGDPYTPAPPPETGQSNADGTTTRNGSTYGADGSLQMPTDTVHGGNSAAAGGYSNRDGSTTDGNGVTYGRDGSINFPPQQVHVDPSTPATGSPHDGQY